MILIMKRKLPKKYQLLKMSKVFICMMVPEQNKKPTLRRIIRGNQLFSRVLRDSTSRFVGPSVGPSVHRSIRRSVTLYFFGVNGGFGLTAPAQMFH